MQFINYMMHINANSKTGTVLKNKAEIERNVEF